MMDHEAELTASLRSDGTLYVGIGEFQADFVRLLRIHSFPRKSGSSSLSCVCITRLSTRILP